MELDKLKKEYSILKEKYKLPSFKEMDENFEIHKIERESNVLLKNVRKIMMEKIVSSLGFIEMLLNPFNAPLMYHGYLKSTTMNDKKDLEKIYKEFSDLSIFSLEREIDYDEKMEAELVKKIFDVWNNVKPEFMKILSNMKKPNGISTMKERSYFG